MTEEEFLTRWTADQPLYLAWGRYVAETIKTRLAPAISPVSIDLFLRLPVEPRVKTGGSMVTKAFYRKAYDDPYEDVTDKVGVRFVVLLTRDIQIVEKVIMHFKDWVYSKDRDFILEREKDPITFEYQSVHYIVRAARDCVSDGIVIPAGTPCEIQIRTILQHAYSELTHDTIYKPSVEATPETKRAAAKSMALIEATNDFFEEVVDRIEKKVGALRKATERLAGLYRELLGKEAEPTPIEGLLLEAYAAKACDPDCVVALQSFFIKEKPFLKNAIAKRAAEKLLFRQPSILLVYYLAKVQPESTRVEWPLTPAELAPIYADLGQRFGEG